MRRALRRSCTYYGCSVPRLGDSTAAGGSVLMLMAERDTQILRKIRHIDTLPIGRFLHKKMGIDNFSASMWVHHPLCDAHGAIL
jgi:hypothetical protein